MAFIKPHSTPIYSQRLAVIYTMALILHKRYDTWGRRRNPDDWSYDDVPTSHIFDRGFTGHQHLDQFGLINMNGRVYDPKLGRFLSPDNNIQAPDNPQNYNRYAYALNNPLKYTDPSGYEYQPHQDDKNWNQSALYNTMMGQRINDGFNWMYSMMDIQTQWLHMGAQRFNDLYGMGAFSTMTSLHNFKNALKNSGSYHFTGEGAQNLFGMMQQGSVDGFNLYDVEAFGRHTIVSSQGDIGLIEFGQSGGIGFSNPTASVFMSTAEIGLSNKDQFGLLSIFGGVLGVMRETFYSEKFGTWLGKDFKLRSLSWGGNGITGGKFKFARRTGRYFKWAGTAAGLYGIYEIERQFSNNDINQTQRFVEQISNGIGFIPTYGTAWSIGWELGKNYGPSTWFGDNDYKWFE